MAGPQAGLPVSLHDAKHQSPSAFLNELMGALLIFRVDIVQPRMMSTAAECLLHLMRKVKRTTEERVQG